MKKFIAALSSLLKSDGRADRLALLQVKPHTLRRLMDIRDSRPHIEISQFGSATSSPKVCIGVHSTKGMTSVMTKADDDAGNAMCSMHARTLGNITGLPVVDRREIATNEGAMHGNDFIVLPRDAAKEPEAAPIEAPARMVRGTLGSLSMSGNLHLLGGLGIA